MNLLIGAISGNYNSTDIYAWVNSSKNFNNVKRVLVLYNKCSNELINFLNNNNVEIIQPTFDFWGNDKLDFNYDTAKCNTSISYELIHNIRFLHIYHYLLNNEFEKVFITDVKDLYFNFSPFDYIPNNKIIATSERIKYIDHQWNLEHLHTNLGYAGYFLLKNEFVYNVGAFGGDYNIVKNICLDIYLLSVGKPKVADQTSFNYLIHTKYETEYSEFLAIHLHVVNEGHVKFDLNDLSKYSIVHQYDRIRGLKYER
ncbi:MAG TPA: hypothetical protein PLY35_08255 [Thermotogota bacterium]|nr:hypothetical protein [Thermotogota bacterium]